MDQPTGRSDQPTLEECAMRHERCAGSQMPGSLGDVMDRASAAYLREDAARIAALEAEREAAQKRAKQEAIAASWFAEQNEIEQGKRRAAEAERDAAVSEMCNVAHLCRQVVAQRDALAAQVASLRKALEWLWGEGVVVFEAMTDDNGSSLWTVDLESVGCDDTDIFYRSLSAATGVPVKHLWPEAEESDEQ